MGLILPGDVCDLRVFVLRRMDHSIATLSACRVARLPAAAIEEATAASPRIARALWWSTLVDESVSREWLVGAGQRRADQQMAHLFCELHARLGIVGRADETGFALPLTQEALGEALGLSTVHAQRTLGALRDAGLVPLRGRAVAIPDLAALQAFAGFDADYLHLDEPSVEGVGWSPKAAWPTRGCHSRLQGPRHALAARLPPLRPILASASTPTRSSGRCIRPPQGENMSSSSASNPAAASIEAAEFCGIDPWARPAPHPCPHSGARGHPPP